MRDARTRRRIAALSLMEMIVVVTIMGLLFVLLANVIGKARDRARTAFCASNLRQLGIALRLYTVDNNQYLPPRAVEGTYTADPTKWPGPPGYPVTKRAVWSDQIILGQYAGSTNNDNAVPEFFNGTVKPHSPFVCPSDQFHIKDNNGILFGSYGMGVNFTWANQTIGYSNLWKISRVNSPSREFVLADGGDSTLFPGSFVEPYPFYGTDDTQPNRTWDMENPNGIRNWAKRHNGGGANVLFLDGHANFYQDLITPYKTGDLRMPTVD